MVRHYNVFPLIPNQYLDTCNQTCLDRNVLLIKCDAVSAEIAVVPLFVATLRGQWILIVYLYHLKLHRTSLCSVGDFNQAYLTRTNASIKHLYKKQKLVQKVDKGIEITLYLKGFDCVHLNNFASCCHKKYIRLHSCNCNLASDRFLQECDNGMHRESQLPA